jgi:CheY-like chemotaxis protein/anti-sigma regulatory factor (Ser/Thr protein kinase)
MPFVLLVDDSPVERRLAGGLMEKELDWLVEYAGSGTEALTSMQLSLPDLLITDLMMPEMDGLQLVTEVRERYPQVPVILITAHGSETLAVEALERGAASYVPKSQLSSKLMETARQVLALSCDDRVYARLMERMLHSAASFEIPNDPALIGRAVEHVVWQVAGMKLCDPTDRRCLGVALEEALLNSFLHGNLELSPNEAQQVRAVTLDGEMAELVAQRCEQDAIRNRTIFLGYEISREHVKIVIRDSGRGFNAKAIPASGDPDAIESGAGRGLVLIKNFMDEVTFNPRGNEITMIKRWR